MTLMNIENNINHFVRKFSCIREELLIKVLCCITLIFYIFFQRYYLENEKQADPAKILYDPK